jgi:ATP-dependent exoDNAse (exonuclease V) alpha subunit
MKQIQALGIMAAGHSVFLTGAAGSGKTHVLNTFVQYARSRGKKVAVTASTGLAATHLGGSTIHSWAGIGIHDDIKPRYVSDMPKSRKEQIKKAHILIIDEVSMLHDFRLDMVDMVCQKIRESEAPFGGLQVILCGDFFQLPPVNRSDSREGGFIVGATSWDMLAPVICYLDEQHRQADDLLLEILTALRAGDVRRRHVEALMARIVPRDADAVQVTELYSRNVNVDTINQRMLDAVPGEAKEFLRETTGRERAVDALQKSCLAPEVLTLKQGAFVMFVKNNQEKKYVNGTLGTVVGFDADSGYPIVRLKNERQIIASPETWELRDGDKKVASITQIPLRLAWAITVHKSQGMTLDGAHVDLSDAFVPGMGYVALSRVKTLDSLSLAGLNRMAITMDPMAFEIDRMLRHRSAQDEKRLQQHVKTWEKLQKQTKKSRGSTSGDGITWSEKLAKMRETYPNAYTPWLEADDQKLLKLFQKGKSVKELTTIFGRHPGSISSRLKKHLGEDLETD